MAQRRIVLVQRFTYRGLPEEWSNTYHFNGAAPASEAGWKTLMDEVWTALKPGIRNTTSLVRGYAYVDGPADSPSVSTVDYVNEYGGAVAGTFGTGTGAPAPGDVAIAVRYSSAKRSVKGKPVYSTRYYHGVVMPTTGGDSPDATWLPIFTTAVGKLVDGTLVNFGRLTLPDGTVCTTPVKVGPYVTTRTLKRRGKRPPTAP